MQQNQHYISEYATKWQPDPEKGADWQQNSLHIAENNAETSRMEAETASYTASDASNWTRHWLYTANDASRKSTKIYGNLRESTNLYDENLRTSTKFYENLRKSAKI